MKNVVFIPNIDLGNGRNEPYEYSIKSWKHFCDKYDCELLVLEDLLVPVESMKVTWQRFYLFDILEQNEIDYDQILLVDADTIVHPDCPNFFELTNHEYSAVVNNGSYEWVKRSMEQYSELMFNNEIPFDIWEYVNCGFQIVNKKHKPFFEFVTNYYHENQELIQDSIEKVKAGTDQTIINFLLRQQGIKINYLPVCYNLQDLHSKQLLYLTDEYWWDDSNIIFEKCGYVFHFNAIPPNPLNRDATYWIKRTYEELYSNEMAKELHKSYYRGKKVESVVGLNWGKPFYNDIQSLEVSSVCDVGCGNGSFLNELDKMGYKNLYGIDLVTISEDMVIKNKNIKYFDSPASSLPLNDKSIDLLTSFECLEHVPITEVDKALKEFSRVSKGYLMLSIAHKDSPEKVNDKNLHLCVKPFSWWTERISKYATLVKTLHKGDNPRRSKSIWKINN